MPVPLKHLVLQNSSVNSHENYCMSHQALLVDIQCTVYLFSVAVFVVMKVLVVMIKSPFLEMERGRFPLSQDQMKRVATR